MSANVGYATLSIIPSFKGGLAAIKGELSGPMSQAGSDAGDDASKSFGEKFKGAMGGIAKVAGAALVAGLAGIAGLEKIGSMFDDAGDSLRITTGKSGQDLTGLEDSFKKVFSAVPVDAGQASTAIGTLNQKLGLTGGNLESSAKQFLNLSRITGTDLPTNLKSVTGAFNSWGITVDDQGERLDELFRISQQTGVSVGDLASSMADSGAQFRGAGLSFDESGALLGLLAKNGLDAGAVIPALSKAMATAAKDGKPAAQVFKDTFAAIAGAPDDTAAAGIALDVFGAKAGPQFAQLIREGKLGYEDFAATVANGGDTINAAASDTDDWREKLKLLANKALLYLEPIATKVFDGIGKAVSFVTPYIQDVAAWLGDHLPGAIAVVRDWIMGHLVPAFVAVGDWVVEHWPQISAVAAAVFDAIADGISYFVNTIVPGAVAGFKAVFGWLMDNKEILIGVAAAIAIGLVALFTSWAAGAAAAAAATIAAAAPFILIGTAIAAVVGGVIYAYNHFQTFHDVVDAVGRFMRDTLWPILQDVFGWLRDNVPPIIQGIVDVATWLWQNVLSPLADFFANVLLPGAIAVFGWLRDNVPPIIQGIIDVAMWLWSNVLSPFVSFLQGAFSVGMAIAKVAFDVVSTAVGVVSTTVGWLWNNVLSPFIGFIGSAFSVGMAVGRVIWDGITSAVGFVSAAVTGLWHYVLEPLVSFIGAGFSIGMEVGRKIWDGITSAVGFVSAAVTGLWHYVFEPLVSFIGGAFSTGMAVATTIFHGIRDAINDVIGFVSTLITKIGDAIQAFKDLNPFQETVDATLNLPGHRAAGGTVGVSGMSWVGERGPELAWLNKGAYIKSTSDSKRYLADLAASAMGGSVLSPQAGGQFMSSGANQLPAARAGLNIEHLEVNNDTDADGLFRMANFHLAGV